MDKLLKGRKIGILVESQFIPGELYAYQFCFPLLGAEVQFLSRLWGQKQQEFISTVENHGESPVKLTVDGDLEKAKVEDYAAIIMAANYTSVRLRYFDPPQGQTPTAAMVITPPAVDFFARAMQNPKVTKGALCHGLWIVTPRPDLLRGRKVICHQVVLADVLNAGAVFQWDSSGVVVDRDLVTGHDWHVVGTFIEKVADTILAINP